MLRVIAGKYKGKKLEQPPMCITRPTKDRVKEALFSMLQNKFKGAVVLDAYGGSGALGIEASSRGASKVIILDINKEPIEVIKANIDNVSARNIDVKKISCVDYTSMKAISFDIIILDPPFANYDEVNKVLKNIAINKKLNSTGNIILETDNIDKILVPSGLICIKTKIYGKSKILLISNNI